MKKMLLVLLTMVILIAVEVSAESIRCPSGRLVSTGDTRMEVISKCGQPDDIEYEVHGNVPIKFFYNSGPNKFIVIITFLGGKVFMVETGNYGFAE